MNASAVLACDFKNPIRLVFGGYLRSTCDYVYVIISTASGPDCDVFFHLREACVSAAF